MNNGINMNKQAIIAAVLMTSLLAMGTHGWAAENLENDFINPPTSTRPSCFWWWFNSLVDKEGITRDLEQFKSKGMGGVTLVCTGNDYGVTPMPRGPIFLSPEWRELYKHAVSECARLGLELGVNFCSGGWCMGGPWITPKFSSRWYVQSLITVEGPKQFSDVLPVPEHRGGYDAPHYGNVTHYVKWPKEKADYRDTAVIGFREAENGASDLGVERRKLFAGKSNRQDMDLFSFPQHGKKLLPPWLSQPGDRPVAAVMDLTSRLKPDGSLEWEVPPGRWTIQRIGHVVMGCDVRCILPEGDPKTWLEIDWLNPDSVDLMFANLGKILIEDAGPQVGKVFKYLHTDSFEDGFPNWTGRILDQFKEYRGYDPRPYLPVLAGKLVGSAEISDRFLYDYRKTVADCMADGSYGHFAKRAAEHGLEIQCEAGGPPWSGSVCMDALKNLGRCARPMGEFWMGDLSYSKQTAIASHIYGRRTASAEAFTSFSHWQEAPSHLKPFANRAFCEGVNRFVFHTMTSQRTQDGKPGYEYGAGTHFNPNVTWWDMAAGSWLTYVDRCQAMLQSGRFVADVLYYYGDWAPNAVDPGKYKLNGYDYDVCNTEVLLSRLSVKDGRLMLPDGMSYRYLVLPESTRMPTEVVAKIKELALAGATIVGPKPQSDPGLKDYPQCDQFVKETADTLWGDIDGVKVKQRKVGQGRIISGQSIAEVLAEDELEPDFSATGSKINFIHRVTEEADFYFLANPGGLTRVDASFRIAGRRPELWDPVSGTRRDLPIFSVKNGCTIVPLEFELHGGIFVVFRGNGQPSGITNQSEKKNFPELKPIHELAGAWDVQFDPQWFYPDNGTGGKVSFEKLEDWSKRPEPAIQSFSGTAFYRKTFDLANPMVGKIYLDLGTVKETARVRLNGKDLGVVWCAPRRVDMTGAVKENGNELEIEVVNLWPNRLIGDGKLPQEQRRTKTNVEYYYQPQGKNEHKRLPSGLLGPVRLMTEQ
jgi:hypothetical protein